ncbi:YopX family protein [Mammaliicoccus sciuri]|uniref:YopX family protein n=1 Tax=Mammaliicoccus sciuri TaxID=1296 RepID=UPI0017834798|nr:YopX family protein [Mammaliicoccus sciuri]
MIPNVKAWHKKSKEMLKVVSINFDEKFIRGLSEVEKNMDLESSYGFDEIEFLQSTGLKDINGKEIFEGDILKYRDEYRVVEMYDGAWVARTGEKQLIVKMVVLSGAEIIGNRFEHPHLLGEG